MPVVNILFATNLVKKYRHDELEGRPHLVVPCTMIGEGVVSGSEGAVLYPKEVLAANVGSWDAHPIVVYHPKMNNKFVSAKSPKFFNSRKVGTIFNTACADGLLKTECWFDEERTKKVDLRIHEAILANQGMEVSTGVSVDTSSEEGEWNGTAYTKKALSLTPDHLAILPDQIGAFSRAMGGGLFANMAYEPESLQTILTEGARRILAKCGVEVVANELSFSAVSRQLAEALAGQYGEKGQYWRGWIEEVFPDYVVFYDKDSCWKVGYSVKDNEVSITGTPSKVTRVTSYEVVSNQAKETPEMSFDKKAHIASLIGNGWDDSDRPFLESMDDTKLQKIQPKVAAPAPTPTPVAANTAPVVPPVVPAPAAPKVVTVNEYLADPNVPIEIRQAAARQLAADATYKATLVQKILVGNAEAGFTAEFLGGKEISELEGWARVADAKMSQQQPHNPQMFQQGFQAPNYRGGVGAPPMTGNAAGAQPLETPLGVPELTFESPVGKR